LDLNFHPHGDRGRLKEVEALLAGSSIVACMGDRLTLASFAMAVPIWSHLLAAVTTAGEALERVREHKPDLLIATEDLEQGYGIALVEAVERLHPPTRTLIFLKRENPLVVNEALEAGADGVMFISSIGQTRGDFLKALECTRDGGVYYPEAVREMARESSPEDAETQKLLKDLSERELDVLKALTTGLSNREIAESLFVSSETVKSHVSAIIGKLGVRDRTQAAILAIRHGGELIPSS
jgi:DNA-binding NarL/FixJ family response regulator